MINNECVTIQENWAPPPNSSANKKSSESGAQAQKPANKKLRTKEQQEPERLNNIVTLQNKVIEGPEEHWLEGE